MTDFICPNCRGGFPAWDNMECPWCEQAIDGSVDPPIESRVTRYTSDRNAGETESIIARLFK